MKKKLNKRLDYAVNTFLSILFGIGVFFLIFKIVPSPEELARRATIQAKAIIKKAKSLKVTSKVIKIDASDSSSFILKSDGTLWASGSNFSGNMGIAICVPVESYQVKMIEYKRIGEIVRKVVTPNRTDEWMEYATNLFYKYGKKI